MNTTRSCGIYDTGYQQQGNSILRTRTQKLLLIIGVVLLLTVPPLCFDDKYMSLVNHIGITIIIVLGLQVLAGYCGIISLGQAGFMGVGAYTSGLLCTQLGLSFWLAIPVATLVAGIVGFIFGLPTLKLRGGFYLVIITLAAGVALPTVLDMITPYATGTLGRLTVSAPPPELGGIVFDSQTRMFFIIMFFVALAIFFVRNLSKSRIRRMFVAISDNDLASEGIGINVPLYRLIAFFICCAFAGVGGSLYAHWMREIGYFDFFWTESMWYFGVIVVGGMGSIAGAILGSVIIRTVSFFITMDLIPHIQWWFPATFSMGKVAGLNPLILSAVVLLFLIFAPRGVVHWAKGVISSFRLWPLSY